MSSDKKRKLEEYASDITTANEENGQSAAQTSSLSATTVPIDGIEEPVSVEADQSLVGSDLNLKKSGHSRDSTPDWTVVGRNGKKRKRLGGEGDKTKYPELTFSGSLSSPVKLGELQNLILYTLADGVGPNWVAFKYPRHTRKVVCLMVPGLEMSMFDGNRDAQSSSVNGASHNGDSRLPEQSANADIKNPNFGRNRNRRGSDSGDSTNDPITITEEALSDSLKPLAAIFDKVWPVKCPGDSKYSRLHSPIQSMLISPPTQSQEQKKMKGPRPAKESQSFQPTRTSVAEFILSPDDLREAEYPMHPASCEAAEDAAIEQERRSKLNQTVADGWVDTLTTSSDDDSSETKPSTSNVTANQQVLAIDCEMVLTTDERYSLARVSVVNWSGTTVYDSLCKPTLPIKNYFTEYSGMTEEILAPVTTTLSDIQTKLLSLIRPSTILMGHSLESDLSALKLTHPHIIDTSLLYPHPRGPPLRSSLKFLTQKYLRREIQKGGAKGHDSIEDALAVLDLVKLKCEKGPKWGTSEMSGEPIFRRLSRAKDRTGNPRTTCVVDYGTPERGYGKDATYAIGCESDAEITAGVIRAVNGDIDGSTIKAGGVDFVWARLRELENHKGWCNNPRDYNPDTTASAASPSSTSPSASDNSILTATISNITSIHASLPPTTLLLIYTGTGDPRALSRLQAMQRQFKREYQVKKWDELSVKWTDVEEQELRRAAEVARMGCGFLAVK